MHRHILKILFIGLLLPLIAQAQNANSVNLFRQFLDLPAPAPNKALGKKIVRDPEFFNVETVPPDDAPLEDLLDYWAAQHNNYSRLKYQAKASDKTIARILEAVEENPEKLNQYLSVLPAKPEVAEVVKRIYDRVMESEKADSYGHSQIREWLKNNSRYYVDELIRAAQKIKDRDDYVQNEDQAVLRSLANVDWNAAQPIIERLESDAAQPYSVILAKWVLYQHALDTQDSSAAEKYRRQLQDIVENREATWRQRDLSMDALVLSDEWEGRDEWYLSLLEDETLLTIQDNGNTGLTTLIAMSPPSKWLATMIKLTRSEKPAVRSAAVRNLLDVFDGKNKEVMKALLPWLANPDWAKASRSNERGKFIEALGDVDLPESVPGLIAVVTNEEEYLLPAAKALTRYKDFRAVPALKTALARQEELEPRSTLINAIIACGGFTDDEQMAGLEEFATLISTPEGFTQVERMRYAAYGGNDDESKPLPLSTIIGKVVSELEEPSEGLLVKAIARQKVLRRTKPAVAKTLAEIMKKWKGRTIYLEMFRQIKAGEADIDTILNLLAKREDVRAKVPNDLLALRGASGFPRGIGACLAEDATDFSSILAQKDIEARIAMLGCARLIRSPLSVPEVGAMLKDTNKLLALAAERYLEAEDSVEARTLVLAQHPSEALILGARNAFVPEAVKNVYDTPALDAVFQSVVGTYQSVENYSNFKKKEGELRAEIKDNAELLAVYALMPDTPSGHQVVRVYKNKIVYTFYEDSARYRERILTGKEYEEFYRFLIENKIDSLSTFHTPCEECTAGEFVMFGRNGGRRVFFQSAYEAEDEPIEKLSELFESLKKGELKLHYRLADKIQGLEVLLADERFPAHAVWKSGDDFRVLVEDEAKKEEIRKILAEQEQADNEAVTDEETAEKRQARYEAQRKRQQEAQYAHFAWRKIENGKLGAVVPQPPEAAFLPDETEAAKIPGISAEPRSWRVRAGNFEIRTGEYYQGGLFKISSPQNPQKIKEGHYAVPIVTGDGKWVVTAKAESNWSEPSDVVRVNLQTGKEFKVNLPPASAFYPIAFLPAHNKVLLYRGKDRVVSSRQTGEELPEGEVMEVEVRSPNAKPNPSPKIPEYYLLDAETGAVQLVKGEFRPLEQQTFRPLQATGKPNQFWAAIAEGKATNIGVYDTKTFAFKSLLKLPDIHLNSMDIWIDASENKIYFVYKNEDETEGHLLSLPLPKGN